MYPLRTLLLRPFAKEFKLVSRCYSHFSSTKQKSKRTFSRPTSASSTKQKTPKYFIDPNLRGIQRQMEAMVDSGQDLNLEEMEGFDDDEELNISAAESLLDAHNSEMAGWKRRATLAMYGQKHYKRKKEPPLLTWADMEHIRHLHQKEEWPVAELAKSFPASEYIIDRVLKTSYKLDAKRILHHDLNVSKNWELLKKDKLDINKELREHCLKFTDRKVFSTSSKDLVVTEKPDLNVRGAFSALLHQKDDAEKKYECQEPSQRETGHEDEVGYSGTMRKVKMKLVTLEDKRQKELEKFSKGASLSEEDKAFVCGISPLMSSAQKGSNEFKETMNYEISRSKEPDNNGSQNQEQSVATKVRSTSEVAPSKWNSSGRSLEALRDATSAPDDQYPEHIKIPETLRKPGAIYRVQDCFYNEAGDFLYRVPGLKL